VLILIITIHLLHTFLKAIFYLFLVSNIM